MTAILLPVRDGSKNSVHLETWEESEETRTKYDNWQNLNPPFVCLDIGTEDQEWIETLQPRRSAEELRETGENSRDLDEEEEKAKDSEDEDDGFNLRPMMNPFPAPEPRQQELLSDPDLLPEFRPWLVPAYIHQKCHWHIDGHNSERE
jgi:hypothetical protein